MRLPYFFLEGEAAATNSITSSFPWITIVYIVAIVAVMYFLMIRPERKRRKEAEALRSSLSVGDTVTTIG
ncbi:MAG: preprotein translocase subunit YajC, partial [Oscillospiraceae bacterium]|nr:preprotein translocase subunit YajC [Oscillospiraceae bacterium]